MKTKTVFLITALLLSLFSTYADDLQEKWKIAPGDQDFMTTGNSERGIAYNPATGHLLLVTRAGGLRVIVLDAQTGAQVGTLDTTDIAGGTFALSLIGVSDDGVIYAGNLSTSTTAPNFKLYRWQNESAVPTIAFEGDPAGGTSNQRWGDSLDVRGSGNSTQVVIASRNTGHVAIFTTTDGKTFTPTLIPGAAVAAGNLSVVFGSGNTLWSKLNGQPLKHFSFDLAAKSAAELHSFASPLVPNGAAAIGVYSNYLGAVAIETPDTFRFYDISNLGSGPISIASPAFPTDNANANNTGYVEFGGDMVFALNSNNGLVAWKIIKSTQAEAPSITTQPASQSILESGMVVFNVGAKGTAPLQFQWQFNSNNIAGATNASLTVTNAGMSAAGEYRVIVQNVAGSVTSSPAVLTVTPVVSSPILTKLWQLAPGARPYIAADNSQRGLAYNPASSNLLVVSRTGGNNIWILNGGTGAEIGKLNIDPAVVFGGTFVLNMIGISDDGKIYAANLTTDSGTSPFNIYRWDSEDTNAAPQLVYTGDPSEGAEGANRRFGDTFAVRGSGANTEILAGSRAGANLTIFRPTTEAATEFTATSLNSDAPAGALGLGLGFGANNNIFGKGDSGALVQVSYDFANRTAQLVRSYSELATSVRALAFQSNYLAAIAIEAPDNLRLYQLNGELPPTLVDQEIFPTDNPNLNGTGSIAFRGSRLYALDSNNGILALAFNPNAGQAAAARLSGATRGQNTFSFTVSGTAGAAYKVESSSDLKSWSEAQAITLPQSGSTNVTLSANAPYQFYRVVAR